MKYILSITLILSSLTAFSQVGLSTDNHVGKSDFISFAEGIAAIDLPREKSDIAQKMPVPLVYSYDKLAFFCKVDVQLENAVKFPVKFRLGSVEYVDYLEGK